MGDGLTFSSDYFYVWIDEFDWSGVWICIMLIYVGLGVFSYLVAFHGREYGTYSYIGFRHFHRCPSRMMTRWVPFYVVLHVPKMILGHN